jgi:transcription termination factor Rho
MAEDITPTVEPAASEDAPVVEQPKRRRGRPRKTAVVEEATEAAPAPAAVEEAPAEEAPKRRRGRPRKVTAPAEDAPAAQAPEAPSEGAAPAPEPAAEGEAPAAEAPKRRRGRPRKSETAAKAAAAEATDAADTAPAESKPEEAAPATPATQLSIEEMTKATQAATKASSVPMGAPTTTLAEADAQQQGGGRRRRRSDNNGSGQQNNQNNGNNQNNRRNGNNQNNNRRRNRRDRQEQAVEPSLTREELAEMKVAELRVKAAELGVEYAGLRKKDLAEAIYEAAALAEGFRPVSGVLEIQNEGYGFLRTGNYMSGENDAFVHQQLIRQHGLRVGDKIVGSLAPSRSGNKYPPLHRIDSVNGRPLEEMRNRPRFRDLTPIYPNDRLVMEHGQESITGRAIDLVAPIGKGQRGLIVSPPKAGKTTVLKRICQSIAANNPEVHLFCLLVDERPEEVTDMERSIRGEVVASTFDMPAENHTKVSELVIEHAKRLVELGEDVVVVLDSITRLARAYNLAQPASGRILSGGVDSAALYPPKKFLGAARNIEHGGSLTILASALVDTGSKMDEVIFEEFKGTGNMELKLDRELADKRIFPAIDPVASGTRNEDLLIEAELQPFVWGIRRILANMNNTERAATALVKGLKSTKDNQEFLIRSARKAQQSDIML